ncbi:cupin domain-containing protein [Saccharothrix variisporea]|uniref:Cupin domain n=1 Tax=Saccharothrix variisporea TaxID=543527 RepID=A0A495XP11_9PSEU|nr:cupin domain-containing protein [Saccharothrix variisporea]RKT74626.1 cupin domain [Saccharothrix variisporea]
MTNEEPLVDFRRLESEDLTRAYGLEMKLLHPWDGLTAPFEGAWCVLRPGDRSVAHAHHEHEIFIGMSGRAEVVTPDHRHPFAAGDIVFLKPGIEHHLSNDTDEDFAYYAIWWDRAMSEGFVAAEDQRAGSGA